MLTFMMLEEGREKYVPMPEPVPIDVDSRPFLEPRLRRCVLVGIAVGSPCSLNAAATAAAALLAVDEVTLLRRLIRCEGFVAPSETEWECCLEAATCRGKLPDIGRAGAFSCQTTNCQLSRDRTDERECEP
jgi:hypothetical protein